MRGNIDISVMWNIQGKALNFSATIQTARHMGHNWQHLVGVCRFVKDLQGRWRGSYFQKKSTAVIEYNGHGHGGAPNNGQWGWNKILQHGERMSVKTDSWEMFMIFGGKLLQNASLKVPETWKTGRIFDSNDWTKLIEGGSGTRLCLMVRQHFLEMRLSRMNLSAWDH
jgi:hypothetical protein